MTTQISGQIPEEAKRRVQTLLSKWRLPPEFINELIEHRAPVSFARNDLVYQQGSTADVAYWVLSGLVKVYSPMPDGTRVIVKIAGPGDLVGTIDALAPGAGRVQTFEAQAMTKVSVAIFTRDHVLALLSTLPSASLVAFLQEVNTAWSEMFSWRVRFLGLSLHERLQWVLENLAARFGVRDSRGIILTPELSHSDLAETIGSSRPMVSRLLAELMQRGELARRDKHFILLKPAQGEPLPTSPSAFKANPGANHRNGLHSYPQAGSLLRAKT